MRFAFANDDGGLWCYKKNILDIEEADACRECEYQEECFNDLDKERFEMKKQIKTCVFAKRKDRWKCSAMSEYVCEKCPPCKFYKDIAEWTLDIDGFPVRREK